MVVNEKELWRLVPDIDLDRIALFVGTAGIGKRKQEQYRREQVDHRKSLLAGRKA